MSTALICAVDRTEKSDKARKAGFIPGIVYGKEIEGSMMVKFEMKKLNQLLQKYGKSAKLNVKIGGETKKCIVKEIRRDPIMGNILHVDMQTVNADDIVKLKAPIVFNGLERLEDKRLLLQIFTSQVELAGQASKVPASINIDVREMDFGEKITLGDIQIPEGISFIGDTGELLAVVTAGKQAE